MTQSSSMTSAEVTASVTLVEIKPGVKFSEQMLRTVLPDVETLLFFGKLYDLDFQQIGKLLRLLFNCTVVDALTSGDHSTELQGYVLDLAYQAPGVNKGDVTIKARPPQGEILPELWASLEVVVAQSIKDVATKLEKVVGRLPGKQGEMVFKSLAMMNKKRPTVGDFKATVSHAHRPDNLVIMDVSGSMTSNTVHAIVNDVVALSYMANAHMAVVSNTTTHWDPGSFTVDDVLRASEFGGTQYETLAPLFDRQDWGTVITIADYDSSASAMEHLARACKGTIEEVVDVSLVNRPTFMAECLGQFAQKVTPMLIGSSHYVLR